MKTMILAAAFALPLFAVPAAAQQFPKDFQGEWIAEGDEPAVCKAGAFDRMESDTIMKVSARDTAQIESSCQLKALKGQTFGASVRLSCSGEGNTWQVNEIWSVRKVAGRTLLITANPKDSRIGVMAKCE
jgi:hypothetical protein